MHMDIRSETLQKSVIQYSTAREALGRDRLAARLWKWQRAAATEGM